MKKMPLVAAVHDLSGYGRCSLTVAIPILSVMGIQCCPLPTAILSNHTAFESFYFTDYTEHMRPYYQEWKKRGLEFDSIYTGFLGSVKQVDIVIEFVKEFRNGAKVVVDPVMGDNGKVYTTYTPLMCQKMRDLLTHAHIITPNLTECCILTNRTYTGENVSKTEILDIAKDLSALGPKQIVITGIRHGDGKINNFAYDVETDQNFMVEEELVRRHFSGTGDVFASVLCGALTNGLNLEDALRKSADFVYRAAKYTTEQNPDNEDGVFFEHFLKEL
ncbi:MAG: pyridoxamine kinase [Clostridia bacterium]|jgi:pyridoxine kinase|nr:pyridoxamine kinase [Clostridia bacterium]